MIADLAKAGQYNSLAQKRITALAAIRNTATHGNLGEFEDVNVRAMIEELEKLFVNWLSLVRSFGKVNANGFLKLIFLSE
jgi:hypothetical protein